MGAETFMKDAEAEGIAHLEAHMKDAGAWLDEEDPPEAPIIKNLFEEGEICAIVGQTKSRKSFFALQMAICVAIGNPFLDYETVQKKTLICNFEVSERTYKKRYKKICNRLNVTPGEIAGKLTICNLKGGRTDWSYLLNLCEKHKCKFCIVDPFYQISRINENDQTACQEVEDKMKLFHEHGITLGVVFHSAKGFSGEKQTIDMISGSGILSRFPDSIVGWSHHATVKNACVFATKLRSYEDADPYTIVFRDGIFERDDSIKPIVETTQTRAAKAKKEFRDAIKATEQEIIDAILAVADGNPVEGVGKGDLAESAKKRVKDTINKTTPDKREVKPMIDNLVKEGRLEMYHPSWARNNQDFYGKPGLVKWWSANEEKVMPKKEKGSKKNPKTQNPK